MKRPVGKVALLIRNFAVGKDIILTRLADAARFGDVESEIKKVEGVRIWVATPQALYRLKKNQPVPLTDKTRPFSESDLSLETNRY